MRQTRKIILTFSALVMLSGCAVSLPPNFVEKAQTDLSTKPLLYQRAAWLKGVYGYQNMFSQRPNFVQGALVCDEEGLMFVVLDKNLNKYISVLDLKFEGDFKNVSVGKWGAGRRLVVYGKSDVYTFEIVRKGALIDKVRTYQFAVFTAGKINQDTEQFAVELEKEKKERKELEGSQ